MDNLAIRKKLDNDAVPWDLLLMADPSREMIQRDLDRGELYLAHLGKSLVGEYVLTKENEGMVEIKNIAVEEKHQGRGIGKELILDAIKRAKKQKARGIRVGTGNSSISQLAFYQKSGFRIVGVIKDFFTKNYKQKIIENDIRCVDMIMLEIKF